MEVLFFRSDSIVKRLAQPRIWILRTNGYVQVEKAIFKVSRHVLCKHSSVLRDMFKVPQDEIDQHGVDEKPVILAGDSVKGWETFLGLIYPKY
jgi:hypothetical protein